MTQEISDIFATFHDGGIEKLQGNKTLLELKIDCTYLAEMEEKGNRFFYLKLHNVSMFEFHLWNGEIINEINNIIKLDLEIGYSKIEDSIIKVSCHASIDSFGDVGGKLWIQADKVELKNHNKETLEPSQLYNFSNLYWNKSKK